MLVAVIRNLLIAAVCACLTAGAAAQKTPKISLDTSETIFSVLAALNACGYDPELGVSAPVRQQVRAEVARAVAASKAAAATLGETCAFYRDHSQGDARRDLAQYVSLALTLGEAPSFPLTVKPAELPPDASYVQGFVPVLKRFYNDAGLHQVWLKHQKEYDELLERFHDPVSKLLVGTDIYLKLPISGYVGRSFTIFVEPLAAPGQVNSRNYGVDYFLVVSPERDNLKLEQIRHAYLHYVLDPLALKRANALNRLQSLLPLVRSAPMDEAYKGDAALLVTESLIRAIEARTMSGGKAAETVRVQAIEKAMSEGFILARHFYEQLALFEQSAVGLKDAYGDWLFNINVDKEKKRAGQIQFARSAAPEIVRASRPRPPSNLEMAERQLAEGNAVGAQQSAEQALNDNTDDPGRALFILAKAAVLSKNIDRARAYFERALGASKEPALVAWSHIYLGRIFDLQEQREAALEHYRAALAASGAPPETRVAAQHGIEKPYAPPERAGEQ